MDWGARRWSARVQCSLPDLVPARGWGRACQPGGGALAYDAECQRDARRDGGPARWPRVRGPN